MLLILSCSVQKNEAYTRVEIWKLLKGRVVKANGTWVSSHVSSVEEYSAMEIGYACVRKRRKRIDKLLSIPVAFELADRKR